MSRSASDDGAAPVHTPASAPPLRPVAEILVALGEPLDFGGTRDGRRRFTPILGGTFRGLPVEPRGPGFASAVAAIDAEILPGGGDRQLLRSDGAVEIDASYAARTGAGTLIGIRARGIRVPHPTGGRPYFRVHLRFEVAAPELAALQSMLFVADGVREADAVRHTVFAVG
ncbi:DUF3237 domain-containing protein [Leucobacter sp. OAMLP11]|nr:DUF3237 domain-containing protein [Leucobacter sp. OAMLP11]